MHEHRLWAHERLLAAAEALSDAQLRQPLAIGQGSVWATLTHLYAAEYVWLGRLEGDPQTVTPGDLPDRLPGNQAGEGAVATLPELRERWNALNARWQHWLAWLTPPDLDAPVRKQNPGSLGSSQGGPADGSLAGNVQTTSCSDVLLHLNLHAQYTTAQAVNMLRQLGASPLPDVMLITLARAQHPDNRP